MPARGRACECVCISLLSTICWQESTKRHRLSLSQLYVGRGIHSQETTNSLWQRWGSLMFVWVWNISITYHDVPDLHQSLNECMYVRMLECMSTPLYVHVTHTQHTYTHTQHKNLVRSLCMYLLRLCQGEPLCVMCAALHRLVTLGTVLELMVLACAIICHWLTEVVQHLNIRLSSTIFLSG